MKAELSLAQPYLPITNEAQINFLLRLLPESREQATSYPIDARFVLDRSGSMGCEAAGGFTKIEALKKAVKQSLRVLRPGKDRVCIVAYDDNMQVVLDPEILGDLNKVDSLIDNLQPGGMTHLSSSLQYALDISPLKDSLPKVILFTDGLVNSPSENSEEKACFDLARQANNKNIPLSIFGTGIDYNENFLKTLAEMAGRGSYYEHVSQVGTMALRLEEDLDNLKSTQDKDVSVQIEAKNGVTILEAFKYVPQQANITTDGRVVVDDFQGLDARGQSYLIKAKVASDNVSGDFSVADIAIKWSGISGPESKNLEVVVNFTADENLISPVDKTVFHTVLNTEAVKATLNGQVDRAKTLFTKTGNSAMVDQLKTLGTRDEDAQRTLRTVVVTKAHKKNTGK